MHQIFDLHLSFDFILKSGFSLFFQDYFSRFHEIRTTTYVQKSETYGSLNMSALYTFFKFHNCKQSIHKNIPVQELK